TAVVVDDFGAGLPARAHASFDRLFPRCRRGPRGGWRGGVGRGDDLTGAAGADRDPHARRRCGPDPALRDDAGLTSVDRGLPRRGLPRRRRTGDHRQRRSGSADRVCDQHQPNRTEADDPVTADAVAATRRGTRRPATDRRRTGAAPAPDPDWEEARSGGRCSASPLTEWSRPWW